MRFFENSEITVMKWPGQSPDLNPIEHLWDELEPRIQKGEPPKNERELVVFLQDEWGKIPDNINKNLVLK
jgi:transposase